MHSLSEFAYLACLVACAALILDSVRARSRFLPPIAVFDRLMRDRASRMTILLFWWWIGWHFLFADTVGG